MEPFDERYRTSKGRSPQPRADEAPLRQSIIALAAQYGRYGYRQVTGLLWQLGWQTLALVINWHMRASRMAAHA